MRGLILLIILALGGWYLLLPDGRAFLDRMRINWTRWENQSRFRSGQPLPGTPDLARLDERLAAQGIKLGVPIYLRIFKLDSELELWSGQHRHGVRPLHGVHQHDPGLALIITRPPRVRGRATVERGGDSLGRRVMDDHRLSKTVPVF